MAVLHFFPVKMLTDENNAFGPAHHLAPRGSCVLFHADLRRYAGLFHPGKFRATAATYVGRISDAATCLVPKASPFGSPIGSAAVPPHSVPRVELDYLL